MKKINEIINKIFQVAIYDGNKRITGWFLIDLLLHVLAIAAIIIILLWVISSFPMLILGIVFLYIEVNLESVGMLLLGVPAIIMGYKWIKSLYKDYKEQDDY